MVLKVHVYIFAHLNFNKRFNKYVDLWSEELGLGLMSDKIRSKVNSAFVLKYKKKKNMFFYHNHHYFQS